FTYVPIKRGKILELCTRNGVIPLLLTMRSAASINGVEIQERLVDMAKRSVKLNALKEQITIMHGDLRTIHSVLGHSRFDVVTCNPPYFSTPSKTEYNKNDCLTIARHEVCCTLEDVVKECKRNIRTSGNVSIIYRLARHFDIL